MERVRRGFLLALAVTMGLFVVACAEEPVEEDEELSVVGRTSVQQVTPGPDGMPGIMRGTPTRELRGALATPGATPSPADIQATLQDLDQFVDRLRNLAGNVPTANDLRDMIQRAETLTAEVSMEIAAMSPNEADLALARLGDMATTMGRVVDTYSRQLQAAGTPGVTTPTPVVAGATPMATPEGTPDTSGVTAQQLMTRVDQLRDQLMRMANGQPTAESIIMALDETEMIVTDMRRQLGTLSGQDLEALTANLADAMDDLSMVIDTYLQQTGAVAPTMTPTASPSPSPSPTLTPSPSPTMSPSPTPVS